MNLISYLTGKVKNFLKNLYFSLISFKKICCLSYYKPINLYYSWVPYDRLQLVHSLRCDARCGRVVYSGGQATESTITHISYVHV